MLLSLSVSLAQANKSTDQNLGRLAEAVKSITTGDLRQAERLLNSVLAQTPRDPDALNLLGVVRAQEQKPQDAERLFRSALVAAPTHVGAHVNLGKLLMATNRSGDAIKVFENAHRLAPDSHEINQHLATLYADNGDYQRAVDTLRTTPRADLTGDGFYVLLRSLLNLKRVNDARQLASEFAEPRDVAPEQFARFAMLLAKGGLTGEAIQLLESRLQQTPQSFPLRYSLGVINAALKRYPKAEEHLSEALKARPDEVTTLRALANVARATGKYEKSLAHLVHARRVSPDDPGVLYDFGVTALQMDLLLDALPVFEKLQSAYPQQPTYLYALAATRWRKGEIVETARLMKNYVTMQPKDPAGFYLLGAALLRQDLIADARAALQTSQNLKSDPNTEYLLGVTYEKEGNRDTAIETFKRVVSARPDHAAAHAGLGAAYREAGNYREARIALERAVELDANDLRANYQLGLVYSKLGQKEAAKKMFARADALRSEQRNQESVILKLIDPQ
jgi:tetratricopeptide (TPR) repeat protein